jgi:hypothetical protein
MLQRSSLQAIEMCADVNCKKWGMCFSECIEHTDQESSEVSLDAKRRSVGKEDSLNKRRRGCDERWPR